MLYFLLFFSMFEQRNWLAALIQFTSILFVMLFFLIKRFSFSINIIK